MEATKPTPDVLMQMQFAMAATRVLVVSTQLGVFTQVAEGKKSVAAIAAATAASERGTRMLLDGLCAFQLLSKKGASYELTPVSAEYLVRGSPSYMGSMIEADRMWDSWSHLGDSVRSGKPAAHVEQEKGAEDFFPSLVRSLHVLNREPARKAALVLKGKRVLDVAAGSGIWGIMYAEANPDARVTAQDFPGVLPVTREFVKKHGLEARFDYLAGDLKTTDYGKARFDLAILGNIVHSEGERSSRALFEKLFHALAPGGRLAIVDMIPNEERTAPPFPVLFALNMLLHTEEGSVYTLEEYRQWLKAAGFARVETADIGSHSPLVIAVKA
jgi:ubiquinone/menaquinone biosynthesis C-methylase UbiE